MNARLILPAVLGAMLIGAPVALAQQNSGARDAHEMMFNPTADFNVSGKRTVAIAKLKSAEIYRMCLHNHGSTVTIIHDKTETKLHGGHCIDVEASDISVKGNDDGSVSTGTYRHDR